MKRYTVKNWLWSSVVMLLLTYSCNASKSSGNSEEPQPAEEVPAVAEQAEPVEAKEVVPDTMKTTKKEAPIPADTAKKAPSPHNAPNQSELDSIKKAKTKGKVQKVD